MDHIDLTPSSREEEPLPHTTPDTYRRDGWTPFARRLFLQVLAETGRVSRACEYCRLSPQSAYALRHRDLLFAAGWDAACMLARAPLADALQEMAVDGVTETIRRDGEIVAERHRHDSRLSIAVLNRLDKRCDRAEDHGAVHLPLIPRWEEWLDLIGKGEDEAALDLLERRDLENSLDHQLHQLPLGENPTIAAADQEVDDIHFWQEEDGRWTTDFPPPPDFDGDQQGTWGTRDYSRQCTAHESELCNRLEYLDDSERLARAERARDRALADMQAELKARTDLPPAAPSA